MWLQIIEISLRASRVCIVVDPGGSDRFLTQLDSFVGRCVIEGFETVRVYYRNHTPRWEVVRLEEFAAARQLPAPQPEGHNTLESARSSNRDLQLSFRLVPGTANGDAPAYRIRTNRLNGAVETINKAVAVIGTALNLDPRSTLQLRLCIYELAMNSVEHGEFIRRNASIDIEMIFGETSVEIIYRDNAEPFPTSSDSSPRLIGEKITVGGKRGLGLYMINKLSFDFRYERDNNWNESSFSLEITRQPELIKKG